MSDWWAATTESGHEQGDLLRDLHVVSIGRVDLDGESPSVETTVESIDAIIVTQSCDLANTKLGNVLLARVVSWTDFAAAQFEAGNTAVKSTAYRRALVRGDLAPLTLLHRRRARPTLPWSVADFRELYTVDRSRLDEFVAETGNRRRLRLASPYKEHFAQAFARFLMRVGLPHDAAAFEREGRAAVDVLE